MTKNFDYPALTVKQLAEFCNREIESGNGNKKILISTDDEGNGYHGLFYEFLTEKEEIQKLFDYGLVYDSMVDPENVVILG